MRLNNAYNGKIEEFETLQQKYQEQSNSNTELNEKVNDMTIHSILDINIMYLV